jgi:hypothetical protein
MKKAVKVIRENLREHPAVQAWSRLRPGRIEPDHIVQLKRKAKGAVYRLAGVGPGDGSVIAKRCDPEKGAIERIVYERVLPHVHATSLDYYGFVEEGEGGFAWLFLEDVGQERYSPCVRDHRTLAARWLGLLHIVAERSSVKSLVPDRGPGHYLRHLRSIRAALPQAAELPSVRSNGLDGRAVLDDIGSMCEGLESCWSEVEALCERTPRTLVHADCLAKNVHIRAGEAGPQLAFFDWGGAGWGLAATDLGQLGLPRYGPPSHAPDSAAYLAVAREHWPGLELDTIVQLAVLGQLFWALKVIDRGLPELGCDWSSPAKVVGNLRIYGAALARSMDAGAWQSGMLAAG